jgi:tRNA A37 threonylcarbamoyladenosine modification protein TsaB
VTTLYIDSSFGIGHGLLNSNHELLEFSFINEKKQSSIIHKLIFEMLNRHGKSAKELKNILISAGPGSYTGMRLASGISDIFEWQDVKVNSFYHFDVPALMGESKYVWIAKAFKGETFCYIYDNGEGKKVRVIEKDTAQVLEEFIEEGHKLYTFNLDSLGLDSLSHIPINESQQILEQNLAKICKSILESDKVEELYYFRSIEEEFKPSQK